MPTDPALRAGLEQLIDTWRGKAAITDTYHATMGTGWHVCAEEASALLRAVPPAQDPPAVPARRLEDAFEVWQRLPVPDELQGKRFSQANLLRNCFKAGAEFGAAARPSRREPSDLPMLTRADIAESWRVTFDEDDEAHIVAFANAASNLRAYAIREQIAAQIRAMPRYPLNVHGSSTLWVRWPDLVALLPPEDGQP